MILEGTIKLNVRTEEGVSKTSGKAWKKATYVLTTDGQYPKDVAFSVFGEDRINDLSLIVGEHVRLGVEIESREWNGKWYTDVYAYVRLDEEGKPIQPTAQPQPQPQPQEQPDTSSSVDETIDLPF